MRFSVYLFVNLLTQEYLGQETVTVGMGTVTIGTRAISSVYPTDLVELSSEKSVLSNPLTNTTSSKNTDKSSSKNTDNTDKSSSVIIDKTSSLKNSSAVLVSHEPLFDRSLVLPVVERIEF